MDNEGYSQEAKFQNKLSKEIKVGKEEEHLPVGESLDDNFVGKS